MQKFQLYNRSLPSKVCTWSNLKARLAMLIRPPKSYWCFTKAKHFHCFRKLYLPLRNLPKHPYSRKIRTPFCLTQLAKMQQLFIQKCSQKMEFHREAWDLQSRFLILAVRLGISMVKVIETCISKRSHFYGSVPIQVHFFTLFLQETHVLQEPHSR